MSRKNNPYRTFGSGRHKGKAYNDIQEVRENYEKEYNERKKRVKEFFKKLQSKD